MRISDWSPDVCSSDLRLVFDIGREDGAPLESVILGLGRFRRPIRDYFAICDSYYQAIRTATAQQIETVDMARRALHNDAAEMLVGRLDGKIEVDFDTARRSEEHTSELQSLMRISYAVFCLKKKTKTYTQTTK